jgi:hypothetical protein
MQITIDLTEEQAKTLQELAATYGVDPKILFHATVRGLFAHNRERFERAAQYVLNKNEELLERLSK